ncbi:MAG: M3 family oligoendopeptidase [Planctomycetota bacterium]
MSVTESPFADAVDPAVRAARRFVPADFDPADVEQIHRLAQALIDREIDGVESLTRWLEDYAEFDAVVGEAGSRRMIGKACDTEDAEIDAAHRHWIEHVAPALAPLHDRLQRKFLDDPRHAELPIDGIDLLVRSWRTGVELFREANVPIQTEVKRAVVAYDKLVGAMSVDIDGQTLTLPQATAKLESTDRELRESVWRQVSQRRLQDRVAMDDLFDELLAHRARIAENAGLPDFRAYQWKAMQRFDYTPDDCHRFADTVEKVVVPAVAERQRRRLERLGVDRLRPWDLAVDPAGRPPLTPFDPDRTNDLVAKSSAVFRALDASLADDFDRLKPGRNLDLASRPAKRPGGFQSALPESGEPFIFMNAAGVPRDVDTMLHEAGHAFHFLAAQRDVPLSFCRRSPMEFCEVASMAMELLAAPQLGAFYEPADAARASVVHFDGVLRVFAWIATIDQFQHWLYTHPDHTRDQRTEAWLATVARFETGLVDWTGLDDTRAADWHRQLHLFHYPFYYIEYGLAEVGALQVWANARRGPADALARYRASLSLGGTCSLPDLFAAAGARFDFGEATIAPLINDLVREIARLDPAD